MRVHISSILFSIGAIYFCISPPVLSVSVSVICENNVTEPLYSKAALNESCQDGHLFHSNSSQCYPIDQRGPCGELMKVVPDPANLKHGYCDCDDYDWDHNNCTYRPKFFWPEAGRCYYAYQRGPCSQNEWLVLNRNSSYYEPQCVENPCPQYAEDNKVYIENNYWFDLAGSCYQTGTQGFCSEPKYRIYLMPYQVVPLCLTDDACGDFIKASKTVCEDVGSRKRRYVGRCRKKVTLSYP